MLRRMTCFSVGLAAGAAVAAAAMTALGKTKAKKQKGLPETVVTSAENAMDLVKDQAEDLVDYLDGLDLSRLKGMGESAKDALTDKIQSLKDLL